TGRLPKAVPLNSRTNRGSLVPRRATIREAGLTLSANLDTISLPHLEQCGIAPRDWRVAPPTLRACARHRQWNFAPLRRVGHDHGGILVSMVATSLHQPTGREQHPRPRTVPDDHVVVDLQFDELRSVDQLPSEP